MRAGHEKEVDGGEEADGMRDFWCEFRAGRKSLTLPEGVAVLHGEQAGGGEAEFSSGREDGVDERAGGALAAVSGKESEVVDEEVGGLIRQAVEGGVEGRQIVGNPGVGEEVADGLVAGHGHKAGSRGKRDEGRKDGKFLNHLGRKGGVLDPVHRGPVGGDNGADG